MTTLLRFWAPILKGQSGDHAMLTDLLLVRAQMRPRVDLETAGRLSCWWTNWLRRWGF